MPEVRGRGLLSQIGLAVDRTRQAAHRGEGIVSGYARLAEQARANRVTAAAVVPGTRSFSAAWSIAGEDEAGVLTLTDTENCDSADGGDAVVPNWRGAYVINVTCETSAGTPQTIAAWYPSGSTTGPDWALAAPTASLVLYCDPAGLGLGIVAGAAGVVGAWTGSVWARGYLL